MPATLEKCDAARLVLACCARGRCTLHGSSTVASVRFLRAASNPVRGDLSIDRPPLNENPFCFSSARRSTAHLPVHKPAAAPMKNKKEDIIRAHSINRSPLTGLEHPRTAERSGESWHFLSVFCSSHNACKVQRGPAHSGVVYPAHLALPPVLTLPRGAPATRADCMSCRTAPPW
jgi:hypothetical protein